MVEKIPVRIPPRASAASEDCSHQITSAELTALLRQQLDCLVSLGKLAELQRDHIEKDRTEDLLQLLLHRQGVVEELARLEDVIGPVRRKWQEVAGGYPAEQREWVEGAFADAKRRLGQINDSDKHDTFMLQQRKHQVNGQLGQMGQSRRVTRGYMPAPGAPVPGQVNITE